MIFAEQGLRSKVTLATAVLVSAILVLVACLTYNFWRIELRRTIATQQDALVSAVARQLDDKLHSAQEQLFHFSRRIDRKVLQDPRLFQAVMQQEDDVAVIFTGGLLLISPAGKVIASFPSAPGEIGTDHSDQDYYKQTISTGKPFISSPLISSTVHKPTIAFTTPILRPDGSLAAILVGRHTIASSIIFSSLRELKIGTGGYLYIIDRHRQIVLHPDPERIMSVVPAGANQGLDRAMSGFEGTVENVNSMGLEALTSFKDLKSADWILATNNPLAEVYAPLQRSLGYFLLVLMGGLLLSALTSRLMMLRLLAPLLALTEHVRSFSERRGPDRMFPVSYSDEIGQLGNAFNSLVAELDEQNRAIHAAAEMYRVVAQFNTELAWWLEEDGTTRYISPNCMAITGYADSEFYASRTLFNSLVHPDDLQLWIDHRKNASENDADLMMDLRIMDRHGQLKYLSHTCHRVFDELGRPQGRRGSFIDVTLLKQMQQTMEDEKRFFGSLIQNAAAPMFVIDKKHTIIFWNNALARLTGRSSFQMVGTKRQWEPFYPTKRPVLADLVLDQELGSIPEYYQVYRTAVLSDHAYRAEGWYDKLGGERRYIFFEAAPIRDSHNDVIAAIETLQDITDRKLSQEAINRQNLFLQEILDTIPNPIFYKDTKGTYIGCNKAFLSFLGREPEELIGKGVFNVLAEVEAAENDAYDKDVIARGASVSYESYATRCDGARRLLLQTKAAFSSPDGTVGGVVGTFVDITEQRVMDEQIRMMSQALEQSPASVVITDLAGNIEYVNPAFCRVTGYSFDEAIGQNARMLKSGEVTTEEYAELWRTITSGQEWRGEFHNRRKDGSLYWESASISPLTDKEGRITGYLAVKEDITARKEVGEALARSQMELMAKHQEMGLVFAQVEMAKREWEETLDSLQDFVILTDPRHRVRRCNRLLCDITRKAFSEVVNQDWRNLLTDSGFEFTSFDGTRGELVHKHSQRLYDLNIYKMDEADDGTISGYVVSLNDTTEIRTITEELQRTSRELSAAQHAVYQQEKMASIGQLAAGVAHEINNPMGFISSNLSTLNKYVDRFKEFIAAQAQLVNRADPDQIEHITELRRKLKIDMILDDTNQLIAESLDGAARVRRIVQDLKSFSRVDQAECSVVDINDCLETTINIAWNEIKYVATLNRDFGELPQVKCFPQQLNQVFLNLLVNAAQALDGRGEIAVKTWSEPAAVCISVSDTGCGIPPEVANRIFEPFFTTKEVGKGTGLGLSISYDIVRKHNGEITVESHPGVGTTFTVRLPVDVTAA